MWSDVLVRPSVAGRAEHTPVRHLRALDGLRGVAVLAVLAFHSGATRAVGGWLGVDVFFVLSGFLITWLLLAEFAAGGRVRFAGFYARRALRLLPALYVVVAAVLLYAVLAPHPVATQKLGWGVVGTLLYVSDIQAATGHVPVLGLIEHTWSLSIEEHFYLLWPPLLVLLVRRGGQRVALVATVSLAGLSALLAPLLWAGAGSVARVYYGPDVRAQALLVGCALAVLLGGRRLPSAKAPQVLSLAGAAAGIGLIVLACTVNFRSAAVYHGGLSVIALLAGVLVAAVVVAPHGWLAALLSIPVLVGLGRISYGLYLWHWPVFLALNQGALGLPWLPTQAVRLVVAVGAASASYLLVERRFLRRRHRFDPPRRAFALAGQT